jgi:hypothetical protein
MICVTFTRYFKQANQNRNSAGLAREKRRNHKGYPAHSVLEGFGGINDGRGQRLARRNDPHHCGLVRIRRQGYGCGCRDGFEDVFFHRCDDQLFELRSQRGPEKCRVQPIMASNRRCNSSSAFVVDSLGGAAQLLSRMSDETMNPLWQRISRRSFSLYY